MSAANYRLQPCGMIIIDFTLQHSREPHFLRNLDTGEARAAASRMSMLASFSMHLGTARADGLRLPGR